MSSLIGSSAGVAIAYISDPLMGLAIMYVSIPVLLTLGLWFTVSWGFHVTFRPQLVISTIRFSLNIIAGHLLDQLSKTSLVFFVNKTFGVNDLGLYNRAEAIRNITTQTADKVVQRVTFPAFSATKRDKGKVSSFIESSRVSAVLLMILIPCVYFLREYSLEIVTVLFGERWLPVSPILQIIALMGLFVPLTSLNFSLMKSCDSVHLVTRNKVFALICYIPVFWIATGKELNTLLYAIVIHSGFAFLVSVFSLSRIEGFTLKIYFLYILGSLLFASLVIVVHKYLLAFDVANVYGHLVINCATLFLFSSFLVFTAFYANTKLHLIRS